MKPETFKKIGITLLTILGIILIFTFIDYLIHILNKEYYVPSRYFANKIIYGTIIGFITYSFLKKKTLLTKSLIFSLVVSILLQVRYFLEGYTLSFIILFLIIHFLILWPTSWIAFKVTKT